MTDNIIKALECCSKALGCGKCFVFGDEECKCALIGFALDLINRQKAEIERLKECPKCIYEYDGNTTEYCIQGPCLNFKTVEQIKSEAYKEFAERLKEEALPKCNWDDCVDVEDIDNLLKEMLVKSDE